MIGQIGLNLTESDWNRKITVDLDNDVLVLPGEAIQVEIQQLEVRKSESPQFNFLPYPSKMLKILETLTLQLLIVMVEAHYLHPIQPWVQMLIKSS